MWGWLRKYANTHEQYGVRMYVSEIPWGVSFPCHFYELPHSIYMKSDFNLIVYIACSQFLPLLAFKISPRCFPLMCTYTSPPPVYHSLYVNPP